MWIARKHDRFTGLSTGDFYELDGDNYGEARDDLLRLLGIGKRYSLLALPSKGPLYYRRYYYVIEDTELRGSKGLDAQAA